MKTTFKLAIIIVLAITTTRVNSQDWTLTGNAGTDPALNFIGTTDNKGFRIKTNNAIRINITSGGNVKIGSGTPASKLDVGGVITATGGTSDNWNSAFGWGNHATAGYLTSFSETDPQVGGNVTSFVPRWNGSSLISGAIYDNTASVGIGTVTVADSKFSVEQVGTVLATAKFLNTAKGPNISWIHFAATGDWYIRSAANAGKIIIQDQAAGNVGIGTTSPGAKLHIVSSTTEIARFDGIQGSYITLNEQGTYRGYVGSYSGIAEDVDFGTGGGNTTGSLHLTIQGAPKFTIKPSGDVCIGTTTPATGYKLSVKGKIISEEFKVQLQANWPDYVFNEDYSLTSIYDLEKSIKQNRHLPGIPSAAEITKEGGFHVGEMQTKLLEKIEELTLYIIQQQKQIDDLTLRVEKSSK